MISRQREIVEIFQDCLRRIRVEGQDIETVLARYPRLAPVLRPELEAAQWVLERRGSFATRPGFLEASRRRLVAGIRARDARPGARSWWDAGLSWWSCTLGRRRMVLYPVLFVLLLVSAVWSGGSLKRAAHTWLPGDPTYPLKFAAERFELLVTPGAAGEARLHIEFARRRLLEVQALTFECRYEQIPAAVADFAYHVERAVQAVGLVAQQDPQGAQLLAADLQGALSGQVELVRLLEGFAPEETRAEFYRVQHISQDGASAVRDVLSPGSSGTQDLSLFDPSLRSQIPWARRGEAPPLT